ncbi:uncharacterized protein LOC128268237 [Anopheles cruzii]|uniref:uncharacterized protein LOC128268237 n=1 Tax=Anopheles cruzii TaxID=68878 RepID=UPI0022EC943F|nr:uncharacterized protein LOC128268237 [Anopheles cruzii]
MFAKIILFLALIVAAVYAKPVFPVAYSSPLLAGPSVAVASPFATPFAAAYTAGPVAAAYTASPYAYSAYSAYPYAAYGSLVL